MSWLGLDIGGANLKAANAAGWAQSVPFALWRDRRDWRRALATLIARAPAADRLAVTMTGELCDCFRTKAEGVRHILAAVRDCGRSTRGCAFTLRTAGLSRWRRRIESPSLAAASNWRALARVRLPVCAGRDWAFDRRRLDHDGYHSHCRRSRRGARPQRHGKTGGSASCCTAASGELPICAVTRSLPWRGQLCPVAAEVFSTTADAYLLLAEISEDPTANWTADGRPLTMECARQRLARQICADAGDSRRTNSTAWRASFATLSLAN